MNEQIIEYLQRLKIPEVVWRYNDHSLLKDFSQFCYLQLLENPPEKLQILYEEGNIANYFFILCKRQSQQGSHFWRLYKSKIKLEYYETYDDIECQTDEDSE